MRRNPFFRLWKKTHMLVADAFSSSRSVSVLATALFAVGDPGLAAGPPALLRFQFGSAQNDAGWISPGTNEFYSAAKGYGFEPGALVRMESSEAGSACTSDKPFYFSIRVPEGNHRVTLVLGNPNRASTNTVKSELRRLMLESVITAPAQFSTQSCIINVRTPYIEGSGSVHLKERERASEMWNWDDKLTLEFNGSRPSVQSIEVALAGEVPTVFLLGDSTVCDQPREPWNSWGQMLPRFFSPTIAVANHAQSGETLKNSKSARRLEKVLSQMRPGDYLFIQFGHNDMKSTATNALAQYRSSLEHYVAAARATGAMPVLITSMERKSGVEQDTLGDYPATVRRVATEQSVPLIDLHALSKRLYRALGPDLHLMFQDGTHHNNYGSYELAKCVVLGIREANLDLAKHILPGFSFDPNHPDSPATFRMPASPGPTGERPLGD